MFLTIGDTEYTLKTTLGVAESIETKFKRPITEILDYVESATIPELMSMICISAGMIGDAKLQSGIKENMDYYDLQTTVQKICARIMFNGTPEQVEEKLERFTTDERAKNAMRGLLDLPIPEAETPSTGKD